MPLRACGLTWALLMASAAAAQLPASAALPAEIDAALLRAKLPRDAVVLLVADADSRAPGPPRLSHRADTPVNPASLMKLVTTYAALDILGPAFVWTTPVYIEGPVQAGVLQGNLYLKGQGDPKLVVERLWLLLRRVQALGITTVAGDIVLDRSAFDVAPQSPADFDGEPARPYNAAPDALLVNYKSVLMTFTPDRSGGFAAIAYEPALAGVAMPSRVPLALPPPGTDCGDWRAALKADFSDPAKLLFGGSYSAACGEKTWPLAYADPASFAARAVERLWRDLGGKLSGKVRGGLVPAALAPAFVATSPALPEVVRDINKFSNNVMAQQLFLTLSWHAKGSGSFTGSRELLRQWWASRLGDATAPLLDNGSGLSRSERISARALASLLQLAWASPLMPELMASLPLAGVDGTLRRLKNPATTGLAHLKTGSLRDVLGIAGVVHAASGKRYVLVAIANHPNAAAARPVLEALVQWASQDLPAPAAVQRP
ncbi:MAG: D-alanyl-D-alanine carboxypeptidase/D-alanyl-D-alanine-endopeptidase [Burkholderiaceae bacterium]